MTEKKRTRLVTDQDGLIELEIEDTWENPPSGYQQGPLYMYANVDHFRGRTVLTMSEGGWLDRDNYPDSNTIEMDLTSEDVDLLLATLTKIKEQM